MMPLKDPEKRRAYHREYMRRKWAEGGEHKSKQRDRIRRNDATYQAEREAVLADFRSSGCRVCGERDDACLTAHHLDPAQKDFNIGDAMRGKLSPARVRAELEKCICLCANCHMKLHAGRALGLDLPPAPVMMPLFDIRAP